MNLKRRCIRIWAALAAECCCSKEGWFPFDVQLISYGQKKQISLPSEGLPPIRSPGCEIWARYTPRMAAAPECVRSRSEALSECDGYFNLCDLMEQLGNERE